MGEDESETRPKNAPLQAGSGCVGVGVGALFLTLCFAAVAAFSRKFDPWIPLAAMGAALTAIGLIAGIPLVRRGKEVARLLRGEGRVAAWTYPDFDDEQSPVQIPVAIGEAGIYVDGNYVYWTPKCQLAKIEWQEDGPTPKLIVTYVRIGSRNQGYGKNAQSIVLPVPCDQTEEGKKAEEFLLTLLPEGEA